MRRWNFAIFTGHSQVFHYAQENTDRLVKVTEKCVHACPECKPEFLVFIHGSQQTKIAETEQTRATEEPKTIIT